MLWIHFSCGKGSGEKKEKSRSCAEKKVEENFSESQKDQCNACWCCRSYGDEHSRDKAIPFCGCVLHFFCSSGSKELVWPQQWEIGANPQLICLPHLGFCCQGTKQLKEIRWRRRCLSRKGLKLVWLPATRNELMERLSRSNLRTAWLERSLGRRREAQTWVRTELTGYCNVPASDFIGEETAWNPAQEDSKGKRWTMCIYI